MKKKNLSIVIIALMLGVLVFGIAGSAYAQTTPPEAEETLPAPQVNRRGFGRGLGVCDGTCDADGDGIPDQLRLRDGSELGGQFGYGFGPGDGTCDADGDGVPDQLRLRDGSGT
ncbi:MAG: PTS system mannose/fructose/sorbose family transporter subunit IID, partial [Chloroflexi bacterium]|nr:PTS system mannose/fructose/sorbose family transporter subunit IID [Chloroflexota bacterium]